RHGNAFGILYATHVPSEGFQRFSVGHELGHYFLGSSLNRVGDFWGWMSDKAVHCLEILHLAGLGIWHQ
ncbi:MAG: hypothetical protein WCD52_15455, partial [Xanthobacteraceae bacterium]